MIALLHQGQGTAGSSSLSRNGTAVQATVRGAVKIVVEQVLRVRMVYVAIYLNIDYASG